LAISILGQIAGIFGLLLAPVGFTWAIIGNEKTESKIQEWKKSAITLSFGRGNCYINSFILLRCGSPFTQPDA
jgi:hypothetical protein